MHHCVKAREIEHYVSHGVAKIKLRARLALLRQPCAGVSLFAEQFFIFREITGKSLFLRKIVCLSVTLGTLELAPAANEYYY